MKRNAYVLLGIFITTAVPAASVTVPDPIVNLPAASNFWNAGVIKFDVSALKTKSGSQSVSIKSNDAFKYPNAQYDKENAVGLSSPIGTIKSMAWNDVTMTHLLCTTKAGIDPCLPDDYFSKDPIKSLATDSPGWAMHGAWALIDLSALKGQKVKLKIELKRYDDKDTVTTDDDLVPGLTAFKGYMQFGNRYHWFPNRHQIFKSPTTGHIASWWGDGQMTKPVWGKTQLVGTHSKQLGYDTAYVDGASDQSASTTASIEGFIQLDSAIPQNNFIALAIGGDARHPYASAATMKHDVNFELVVTLSNK
jgi:hypothetical protein